MIADFLLICVLLEIFSDISPLSSIHYREKKIEQQTRNILVTITHMRLIFERF